MLFIRYKVFDHIKRFLSKPSVQCESSSALLNLVDITFECIGSLYVFDHKICGFADSMSVYIMLQKLDPTTKLWFEHDFGKTNETPKSTGLMSFLKNCARTLEVSIDFKNVNQKHYPQNSTLLTHVKS